MLTSISRSLTKMRPLLITLMSTFGVALFVNPAAAAADVTAIDKGVVAAIIVVGMLLFVLVFEVWRTVRSGAVALRSHSHSDIKDAND